MVHYDLPDELLLEMRGPIRILTMNKPDLLNAFVDPLHDAMVDVWRQLAHDDEARVVIVTGAGRAFSAGGNIPGFIDNYENPAARRVALRDARRLAEAQLACHLPVIAAVNGPAVGLGCSIAAISDIVLIDETAFMADTHVNVGLVAGDGGAMSWPLMMSILKAKEYLFTGERIPAAQAVELGLANRVVAAGTALQEAVALAEKLAAQPPQALQETKRAVNLHLQQAALLVLPFATMAEAESFSTPEVKVTAENFAKRNAPKE